MIILNLLPPAAQSNIVRFRWINFFKQIGITMIVGILCAAVLILGTRWWFSRMLREHESSLLTFENLLSKTKTEKAVTIKQQQNLLKALAAIQKDEVEWIPWIQQITSIIPPDLELDELTFNETDHSIVLIGTSDSRASVLDLKNNLENLEHVKHVDLPLSSIFSAEHPPITLTSSLQEWK
jgi:Tfp pilus assembly protein PilN